MEAENTIEKKNNKKTIIITICVIAIVLICGGLYLSSRNREEKKPTNNTTKQEETISNNQNEETVKEEKIELKTDIRTLIYYTFGVLSKNETSIKTDSNKIVDRSIGLLDPYGTLNKVNLAILVAKKFPTTPYKPFKYDDMSDNMKSIISREDFEQLYETYARVDAKLAKEYYKKLFGEEMPEQQQILKEGLYYDSVDNYFYLDRKMWWASNYAHIVYINRIEEQGDNAYAYINVGHVKSMASSIGPGYTVDIYNDFSGDNFVETKEVPIEIDETNYTKYQEYKYTFKKADENGNYYLVSIDKN